MSKSQTLSSGLLENLSDSDYCDNSDKKNIKKRKSKKRETKKSSKSKKSKNSKLTEKINVAPEQTINNRLKESENIIKKDATILTANSEIIHTINIKPVTEETRVNKYIKKSIQGSSVFDTTVVRNCILSKKCDSVNNNEHSKVLIMDPISKATLEKPNKSSFINATTLINTKKPPYMPSVPSVVINPTIKLIDIKCVPKIFPPILEPIHIKEDAVCVIDGMYYLILT